MKNKKSNLRIKKLSKGIYGTSSRHRLVVSRSLKHIYAQIINDEEGKTILSFSTLSSDVRNNCKNGSNKEAAQLVGKIIAQKAVELGIDKVVFDRNGRIFHGRIKSLAEGARKAGLQF